MINGIIPAVITPMKDGEIDYTATEKHIDLLIKQGVHGLFILGTNGEFHVLSNEEKEAYAKFVIHYTDDRVPVYVGVGECGTKETIKLAKAIEKLQPTALTVISPYMVKHSQKELENHFRLIAHSVKLPIILYNIPSNTGVNIDPSTLKALEDCSNIVGIKDSSGNMDNLQGYIEATKSNPEFSVLVGSDSKILAGLKLGAKGAVASTANAIAPHVLTVYNNFQNNNLEKAEELQIGIDVIRGVLKLASTPAIIKRVVSLLGNDVGEARLPVEQLGNKYDEEIKRMLKYYY